MNLERIEALVQVVQQADVAEVQVEGEGWRINVRKGRPGPRAEEPPAAPAVEEPAPAPRRVRVAASLVGRFHAEDGAPRAGDRVEAGQVLGSIESMGIRTPLAASEAGEIVAVLVTDGQGVEYGQELFEIAPPGDDVKAAPAPAG